MQIYKFLIWFENIASVVIRYLSIINILICSQSHNQQCLIQYFNTLIVDTDLI